MNERDREQEKVVEQLRWDPRVNANEMGVTVKDGVVTLVGTVDAYCKKWTAGDVALRVAGVTAVVNDLEVELPSSSVRADEDIAEAAQHALESALDVPTAVEVVVGGAWVTLRGEVEWQYQKEAAERTVRDLVGVKNVINQIGVEVSRRTAGGPCPARSR